MSGRSRPLRVFMPCPGLGRERRGFETFTRECAQALAGRGELEMTVFGGGSALLPGERHVASLSRQSRSARGLGALVRRDPYFVEQASFFAAWLPELVRGRPDVVYFADLNVGNACWHWRRVSGQRFRLLFYNGGPTTRPFTRCDLVQQVSPEHLASALSRGERAERQVLLPHGLHVPRAFTPITDAECRETRAELGVPLDAPLLLSVGALNASHKRMDVVIRETAMLPVRPHLLLLGEADSETPALRALATEQLGTAGFTMRSVPRERVLKAYRAADAFVLASVVEGFGLAHLEALASGVACVAHESPTTAFLYGPHARRADLRAAGALAPLLADALRERPSLEARVERHSWVRDRFGWESLAPRYVELLHRAASADLGERGAAQPR